ncbi:hypothetical protein ABPG72_009100 [Tetrahymena utriculariae]
MGHHQKLNLLKLEFTNFNSKVNQQRISKFLEGVTICSSLRQIDISFKNSDTCVDGIQVMSQSISNNLNLKVLQLELYFSNLNDEKIKYLCQGISKSKKLCKFDISLSEKNRLTDNSIVYLSKTIVQLPNLQILVINLIMNNLGETGIGQILGQSISKCQNLKSLVLNLVDNKISQNDAEILCKEISKSGQLNRLKIYLYFQNRQDKVNNRKKLLQICQKTKKLISLAIYA